MVALELSGGASNTTQIDLYKTPIKAKKVEGTKLARKAMDTASTDRAAKRRSTIRRPENLALPSDQALGSPASTTVGDFAPEAPPVPIADGAVTESDAIIEDLFEEP